MAVVNEEVLIQAKLDLVGLSESTQAVQKTTRDMMSQFDQVTVSVEGLNKEIDKTTAAVGKLNRVLKEVPTDVYSDLRSDLSDMTSELESSRDAAAGLNSELDNTNSSQVAAVTQSYKNMNISIREAIVSTRQLAREQEKLQKSSFKSASADTSKPSRSTGGSQFASSGVAAGAAAAAAVSAMTASIAKTIVDSNDKLGKIICDCLKTAKAPGTAASGATAGATAGVIVGAVANLLSDSIGAANLISSDFSKAQLLLPDFSKEKLLLPDFSKEQLLLPDFSAANKTFAVNYATFNKLIAMFNAEMKQAVVSAHVFASSLKDLAPSVSDDKLFETQRASEDADVRDKSNAWFDQNAKEHTYADIKDTFAQAAAQGIVDGVQTGSIKAAQAIHPIVVPVDLDMPTQIEIQKQVSDPIRGAAKSGGAPVVQTEAATKIKETRYQIQILKKNASELRQALLKTLSFQDMHYATPFGELDTNIRSSIKGIEAFGDGVKAQVFRALGALTELDAKYRKTKKTLSDIGGQEGLAETGKTQGYGAMSEQLAIHKKATDDMEIIKSGLIDTASASKEAFASMGFDVDEYVSKLKKADTGQMGLGGIKLDYNENLSRYDEVINKIKEYKKELEKIKEARDKNLQHNANTGIGAEYEAAIDKAIAYKKELIKINKQTSKNIAGNASSGYDVQNLHEARAELDRIIKLSDEIIASHAEINKEGKATPVIISDIASNYNLVVEETERLKEAAVNIADALEGIRFNGIVNAELETFQKNLTVAAKQVEDLIALEKSQVTAGKSLVTQKQEPNHMNIDEDRLGLVERQKTLLKIHSKINVTISTREQILTSLSLEYEKLLDDIKGLQKEAGGLTENMDKWQLDDKLKTDLQKTQKSIKDTTTELYKMQTAQVKADAGSNMSIELKKRKDALNDSKVSVSEFLVISKKVAASTKAINNEEKKKLKTLKDSYQVRLKSAGIKDSGFKTGVLNQFNAVLTKTNEKLLKTKKIAADFVDNTIDMFKALNKHMGGVKAVVGHVFDGFGDDIRNIAGGIVNLVSSLTKVRTYVVAIGKAFVYMAKVSLRAIWGLTKGTFSLFSKLLKGIWGLTKWAVGKIIQTIKYATAAATALGVMAFRAAEKWQTANAQLKLVSVNYGEWQRLQDKLFDVAQDTRMEYTKTAKLFVDMKNAMSGIAGVTEDKILKTISVINKAVAFTGDSAASVDAALVQFMQAFAADFKSAGQEMNSVREQAKGLYNTILDGMEATRAGFQRGQFKSDLEDGLISSFDIMEALLSQSDIVGKKFLSIPFAMSHAWASLTNQFMKYVGQLNETYGITTAITKTLKEIGDFAFGEGPSDTVIGIVESGMTFMRYLKDNIGIIALEFKNMWLYVQVIWQNSGGWIKTFKETIKMIPLYIVNVFLQLGKVMTHMFEGMKLGFLKFLSFVLTELNEDFDIPFFDEPEDGFLTDSIEKQKLVVSEAWDGLGKLDDKAKELADTFKNGLAGFKFPKFNDSDEALAIKKRIEATEKEIELQKLYGKDYKKILDMKKNIVVDESNLKMLQAEVATQKAVLENVKKGHDKRLSEEAFYLRTYGEEAAKAHLKVSADRVQIEKDTLAIIQKNELEAAKEVAEKRKAITSVERKDSSFEQIDLKTHEGFLSMQEDAAIAQERINELKAAGYKSDVDANETLKRALDSQIALSKTLGDVNSKGYAGRKANYNLAKKVADDAQKVVTAREDSNRVITVQEEELSSLQREQLVNLTKTADITEQIAAMNKAKAEGQERTLKNDATIKSAQAELEIVREINKASLARYKSVTEPYEAMLKKRAELTVIIDKNTRKVTRGEKRTTEEIYAANTAWTQRLTLQKTSKQITTDKLAVDKEIEESASTMTLLQDALNAATRDNIAILDVIELKYGGIVRLMAQMLFYQNSMSSVSYNLPKDVQASFDKKWSGLTPAQEAQTTMEEQSIVNAQTKVDITAKGDASHQQTFDMSTAAAQTTLNHAKNITQHAKKDLEYARLKKDVAENVDFEAYQKRLKKDPDAVLGVSDEQKKAANDEREAQTKFNDSYLNQLNLQIGLQTIKMGKDAESTKAAKKAATEKRAELKLVNDHVELMQRMYEIQMALLDLNIARQGLTVSEYQKNQILTDQAHKKWELQKAAYDYAVKTAGVNAKEPTVAKKLLAIKLKTIKAETKYWKLANKNRTAFAKDMQEVGRSFADALTGGDIKGAFQDLAKDIVNVFVEPLKDSFSTIFSSISDKMFGGIFDAMTEQIMSFSTVQVEQAVMVDGVKKGIAAGEVATEGVVTTAKIVGTEAGTAAEIASVAPEVKASGIKAKAKGLEAVTNVAASFPGPAAFVAAAAMIALLAGIGIAMSGGGGSAPSEAEISAAKGENLITSDSVGESIKILEENSTIELEYSAGILASLKEIVLLSNAAAANIGLDYSGSNYVPRDDKGFFNDHTTELLAQGIRLDSKTIEELTTGGATGRGYQNELVTNDHLWGIGSNTKIKTSDLGALDEGVTGPITEAYLSMIDGIKTAAEAFGISASEFETLTMDWATTMQGINLEGMDEEEIASTIEGVIGADANALVETLAAVTPYINEFKLAGEDAWVTMVRLVRDYEMVKDVFAKLGVSLSGITEGGLAAAEALIQAAGGTEAFADKWNYFYENFYSDTERMAIQTQQMDAAFAAAGMTIPATSEAYRDLVAVETEQLNAASALYTSTLDTIEATWLYAQSIYEVGSAEYIAAELSYEGSMLYIEGLEGVKDQHADNVDMLLTYAPAFKEMENAASSSYEELKKFWDLFGTEAEQAAFAQEHLEALFGAIGMGIPVTKEAFKNIYREAVARADASKQKWKDIKADFEAQALVDDKEATNKKNLAEYEIEIDKAVTEATLAMLAALGAAVNAVAALPDISDIGVPQTRGGPITQEDVDRADAEQRDDQFVVDTFNENLPEIAAYYDGIENIGNACEDAAAEAEALAQAIEGIFGTWVGSIAQAEMALARVRQETGLVGIDYSNYLEEFLSRAGSMNAEQAEDWAKLGDALMAVHDAMMAFANSMIDLEAIWGEGGSIGAGQSRVDLARADIGAAGVGVNSSNFWEEFQKAKANGMDTVELAKWTTLSEALLSLEDAIKTYDQSMLALQSNYIDGLKYNRIQLQQAENALGRSDITSENFLQEFNALVDAGLMTPEQMEKWQELSDAILTLDETMRRIAEILRSIEDTWDPKHVVEARNYGEAGTGVGLTAEEIWSDRYYTDGHFDAAKFDADFNKAKYEGLTSEDGQMSEEDALAWKEWSDANHARAMKDIAAIELASKYAAKQAKWEQDQAEKAKKAAEDAAKEADRVAKILIDGNKASIKLWEDWQDKQRDIAREYGDFLDNKLQKIMDAYDSELSYLNSIEKAEYFKNMRVQLEEDNKTSAWEKELTAEKFLSPTKEDYIPKFDAYIRHLQRQEPEKTLDDIEETLEEILAQNKRTENAISRSSYQKTL